MQIWKRNLQFCWYEVKATIWLVIPHVGQHRWHGSEHVAKMANSSVTLLKKKKKGCELELLPARFVPTEPGMFSIPSGSNKFHFLKAVPDLRSFSLSNSAGRACVLKAWEWWRLRRLNTMATFPPLRIQQPLQKKIKNTGSIHLQVFSPLGVFQHLLLRVTQGLRKTSSVSNCGSGFFIWPSGNKWKKKNLNTHSRVIGIVL